jgi:HD-GYP domain-containing protein (c-di-GMP phosphodiesterase class II)
VSPIALCIVRSHHERLDGAGFPDALQGDKIPREARIVSVVDAFDAMTTSRAYRASRSASDAFDELHCCAGTHFDAEVVDAFAGAFRDLTTLPLGR